MAQFKRVVRWSGGLVAVAPPIQTDPDSGAMSQLFYSDDDGASWAPARPVFEPGAIVVGLNVVADTVVALTLPLVADYGEGTSGWGWGYPLRTTFAPPLVAWSSPNGAAWTRRGEPIRLDAVESSTRLPLMAANATSAVVIADAGDAVQVARSSDGETWSVLSSDAPPPSLDRRSLAAVGGGFLLIGQRRGGDGLETAAWSADGSRWGEVSIFGDLAADVGEARVAAVGRAGVVVEARTSLVPGTTWWFSSIDGRSWRFVDGLSPIGLWQGSGAGTSLFPNGAIAGDGERMVAYDTVAGSAGWTSFDGVAWTQLAIGGARPPWYGLPNANLTVLPGGIVWRDGQRHGWFAEASTDG